MILEHYIYYALSFYHYYINSDHQELDPRGSGPLVKEHLGQGSVNFFLKGQNSNYFKLGRPYDLCHNYSTMLLSLKAAIGSKKTQTSVAVFQLNFISGHKLGFHLIFTNITVYITHYNCALLNYTIKQ